MRGGATASEVLAGPDDDGIRLELSAYGPDFHDAPGGGPGDEGAAKAFSEGMPSEKTLEQSGIQYYSKQAPAKGCAEFGVHFNGSPNQVA